MDNHVQIQDQYRIEHYGSRFFAVYEKDQLVAVTVYRKGAREVVRRLCKTEQPSNIETTQIQQLQRGIPKIVYV